MFRDKTNLAATPDLWGTIERALSESEFFLLLASPRAAQSQWVQKEVDFWRNNKAMDRLLIVLTEGELVWDDDTCDFDWTRTTAVPRALSKGYQKVPLWVDFRQDKIAGRLSLRSASFRSGILDLAATIRGEQKDALDGEDVREHRKALLLARLGVTALTLLFAVAATAAWIANEQRKEKEAQREIAVARQLAAQSVATRDATPAALEQSALLAVQSLRRFERRKLRSLQADNALRDALALVVHGQHRFELPRSARHEIAFRRDGPELAAADRYRGVRRWVLEEGRERPGFDRGRSTLPRDVHLSPDGTHFASTYPADASIEVRVDSVPGSPTDPAPRFTGREPVALGAGGQLLALRAKDVDEMRVLEVETGNEVARIPTLARPVFSPAGTYLAGSLPRGSALWRTERKAGALELTEVSKPRLPSADVLAFSSDGDFIAAAVRGENNVSVFDLNSGRTVARVEGVSKPGMAMALGPDGTLLALAGVESISVHDTSNGAHVLLHYGSEVGALAFDASGRFLAAAGPSGDAEVWRLARLSAARPVLARGEVVAVHVGGGTATLTALTTETGARGERSWSTEIWRLGPDSSSERRPYGVGVAALSSNGSQLAMVDDRQHLRLWELATRTLTDERVVDGPVARVAVSDDGRYVLLDGGGRTRIVDRRDELRIPPLEHPGTVTDAQLGAHGWYLLASQSETQHANRRGERSEAVTTLWDLRSGTRLREVFREPSPRGAQLGPAGRYIARNPRITSDGVTGASESSGGLVRPIHPDGSGDELPYDGGAVIFSPDGQLFATLDSGWVEVWDLTTKREIARVAVGRSRKLVALSDAAEHVATLDGKHTLEVWPLTPAGLLERACSLLERTDLDAATWSRFVDDEPYLTPCTAEDHPSSPEPPSH